MRTEVIFEVCCCNEFKRPHGYIYVIGKSAPSPVAFSAEFALRYLQAEVLGGGICVECCGRLIKDLESGLLPYKGVSEDQQIKARLDEIASSHGEAVLLGLFCGSGLERVDTIFNEDEAPMHCNEGIKAV